jgi:hypothetical protein
MDKVVSGQFVSRDGGDYYCIANYDALPPFFMTIVSGGNHWLFVSSSGGVTAGRVNSDLALFPYETVDKIHESTAHTGPITILRVRTKSGSRLWQPFDRHALEEGLTRNLYKHVLGTSLLFEEQHQELGLSVQSSWETSDKYGFVRRTSVTNRGAEAVEIELLDGVRNVVPTGIQLSLQQQYSSLTDAYKTAEVNASLGVATYALTSAISDRAEPQEALKCAAVWGHGLPNATYTLDPNHVAAFKRAKVFQPAHELKGRKGSFLASSKFTLAPGATQSWIVVADVNLGQTHVESISSQLKNAAGLLADVTTDVAAGQRELSRILGLADGFQASQDPKSTVHHTANVLFNCMRGGVFVSGYEIDRADFCAFVDERNKSVRVRQKATLERLPDGLTLEALISACQKSNDADLVRLGFEYLPLTFSRRHGDPSRPWNRFNIQLRGPKGERSLNYEGNWRDIFQNWEALCFSYPLFLPSVIAKFVNSSTLDGFNPYRVNRAGLDWEVPEPHDPWANIGYWGDHQVVYLLRLLEWCDRFLPGKLQELLGQEIFSYADVPYRIKPYEEMLLDVRNTIEFDRPRHQRALARVAEQGGDGRLVRDAKGGILHVNLAEKLCVTMLSKLSNFIVGGGIWLNAQRPEWNDANNALVGYAASMVTLYHLRRYQDQLRKLLGSMGGKKVRLSSEVAAWFADLDAAYRVEAEAILQKPGGDDGQRKRLLDRAGKAFSDYRDKIAEHGVSGTSEVAVDSLVRFIELSIRFIDHSIASAQRENGLYDAYNLLEMGKEGIKVRRLYDMLEGQVSALSSGQLSDQGAAGLLDTMAASALYREDQHSYLLYPNRRLPSYLERNQIPQKLVEGSELIKSLLARNESSLVSRDVAGHTRFNVTFGNAKDVTLALDTLSAVPEFAELVARERTQVLAAYEAVFKHAEFTGRSGAMYGYEGLGCIYWHMVAKLLLATQECALRAKDQKSENADKLAEAYYRVRAGLCFNKPPAEYGAFPMDPYSHTPPFAGAQQPGMTGQVKEVVLTRFGELGVRVEQGALSFVPKLLRRSEFLTAPTRYEYLSREGEFRTLSLTVGELAFTYCQVPVVYSLGKQAHVAVWRNGRAEDLGAVQTLSVALSSEIFRRTGAITRINVTIPESDLLS